MFADFTSWNLWAPVGDGLVPSRVTLAGPGYSQEAASKRWPVMPFESGPIRYR